MPHIPTVSGWLLLFSSRLFSFTGREISDSPNQHRDLAKPLMQIADFNAHRCQLFSAAFVNEYDRRRSALDGKEWNAIHADIIPSFLDEMRRRRLRPRTNRGSLMGRYVALFRPIFMLLLLLLINKDRNARFKVMILVCNRKVIFEQLPASPFKMETNQRKINEFCFFIFPQHSFR